MSWPTLSVKRHCCSTCSGGDNGAGVNSSNVWTEGMIKSGEKKQPQRKIVSEPRYNLWETALQCRISLQPQDLGQTCSITGESGEKKSMPDNEVILVKVIPGKLELQDLPPTSKSGSKSDRKLAKTYIITCMTILSWTYMICGQYFSFVSLFCTPNSSTNFKNTKLCKAIAGFSIKNSYFIFSGYFFPR